MRLGLRWFVLGVAFAIALGVPAAAGASEAAPSVSATAPYELDFTLPSESRSGCLVCHGDPALVRVREGVLVLFYVDEDVFSHSTHMDQQCVACHLDFAYRAPHGGDSWAVTAKSACRNCHDEQSRALGTGVHRTDVDTTVEVSLELLAEKPLCGDCHGNHNILPLTERGGENWKAGQAALHADGWETCGRCHQDYWDRYDDYYHGAAYKRGANDAPACWDCHGWHDILPADDRGSRVNEAHLVETCGQEGCHLGVDENYTKYAVLIHGRAEIEANNPLLSIFRTITNTIGRLFGGGGEA